jgi:fibrillarin-like rRNA methylase
MTGVAFSRVSLFFFPDVCFSRPSWSALIQQAEGYGYENIVFLAEDYQLESLSEQFNVLIVDDFQSTAPLAAYAAKALHAVGPQGGVMLLMNASVISPERKPEEVFAGVVREMRELKPQLRPKEQLTLEPFERNCAWLSAERRTQ